MYEYHYVRYVQYLLRKNDDDSGCTSDGDTESAYVGQDASRPPGAQCYHRSTLQPPHIAAVATDGSAPSIFDPNLDYSTERVVSGRRRRV